MSRIESILSNRIELTSEPARDVPGHVLLNVHYCDHCMRLSLVMLRCSA